jgi:alpha-N-arabinofuranosidase
MDAFISGVTAICDYVKALKRSEKTVYLSFDEWNVWFHSQEQDKAIEKWQVAPPLLEDVYNFEDALVVGCLLITLLRHADRVKIACLAQLVNVIAPIMTENGGRAWAQTIFYPFMHASLYGRGKALRCVVECESYGADKKLIPYVESVAAFDEDLGELTVFAVNRSLDKDIELSLELAGFGELELIEHLVLNSEDLKAVNTADSPEAVLPCPGHTNDKCSTLSAHSWNVIRFKVNA